MLRYTAHKETGNHFRQGFYSALAEARRHAEDVCKKVMAGDDPIAERKLNRPEALTTVNELLAIGIKILLKD